MPKYVVRFGAMRMLGVFSAPAAAIYCRGARVIACTERGIETATVLGQADETLAAMKDQPTGQILRVFTAEDDLELSRIAERVCRERAFCLDAIKHLRLEMTLVAFERIFGGERVIVYYLAENRVDFRELVRLLAAEFQTGGNAADRRAR